MFGHSYFGAGYFSPTYFGPSAIIAILIVGLMMFRIFMKSQEQMQKELTTQLKDIGVSKNGLTDRVITVVENNTSVNARVCDCMEDLEKEMKDLSTEIRNQSQRCSDNMNKIKDAIRG